MVGLHSGLERTRGPYSKPISAMILCAGRGERLGSLTRKTPKPMVRVGGYPVISWIFNHLAQHGVQEIIVNIHHQPLQLIEYLGSMVYYSAETKLMGTAGAFKKISWWLSDPFIVCNGDTITNVDIGTMVRMHQDSKAIATVFTHKTLTHNGGVFVFSKKVMECIPSNKPYSIHKDLIPELVKDKQLITKYTDIDSYYYDIGTPEGLRRARKFFKDEKPNPMSKLRAAG